MATFMIDFELTARASAADQQQIDVTFMLINPLKFLDSIGRRAIKAECSRNHFTVVLQRQCLVGKTARCSYKPNDSQILFMIFDIHSAFH